MTESPGKNPIKDYGGNLHNQQSPLDGTDVPAVRCTSFGVGLRAELGGKETFYHIPEEDYAVETGDKVVAAQEFEQDRAAAEKVDEEERFRLKAEALEIELKHREGERIRMEQMAAIEKEEGKKERQLLQNEEEERNHREEERIRMEELAAIAKEGEELAAIAKEELAAIAKEEDRRQREEENIRLQEEVKRVELEEKERRIFLQKKEEDRIRLVAVAEREAERLREKNYRENKLDVENQLDVEAATMRTECVEDDDKIFPLER